MLPLPQLLAYPLLLAAIYAIYRVGKDARRRSERFEWARLTALASLLGLVTALQVRFIAAGYVDSPFAMLGAILSIAGVFGLVGVNMLDAMDARRARKERQTDATTAAAPYW